MHEKNHPASKDDVIAMIAAYIRHSRNIHLMDTSGNINPDTGRKMTNSEIRRLLKQGDRYLFTLVNKMATNPDAIHDFLLFRFHKLALGTLPETPEEVYAIAMQDGPYAPPVPSDAVVLAHRNETLRALAEWRFKWNDMDDRCIRLEDWIRDHVQNLPGLIAARNLTVPALVAARDQAEVTRPMPTPEEMWQMANPNLIAPPA